MALSPNSEWQLIEPARSMLVTVQRDPASLGFLHRLDVPSSGLILAAKSFKSYYDLQAHAVLYR